MTTVINYVAIYHHVVMDFMLREQDPHLSICCSMCVLFHRGIEWVSLTSFLSFATSTPNNMGLVRNELQHVNLPTGKQPDTHKKHINLKSFPHLRLLIHTVSHASCWSYSFVFLCPCNFVQTTHFNLKVKYFARKNFLNTFIYIHILYSMKFSQDVLILKGSLHQLYKHNL